MKKLCVAMILACSMPASALACPGPFAEKATLLEALPPDAMGKDIVAKVKLQSFEKVEKHRAKWKTYTNMGTGEETRKYVGTPGAYVKAVVVEAVKNIKVGDEVTVFISPFHSCAREPYPPEIGREAYVAGTSIDGIIEGEWNPNFPENMKLLVEKWKKNNGTHR